MALAEAKNLPRLVKKIRNVHEITAWLENIGMGEYRNVFVREEIYTDLLHIIDDSFLQGIGITDTFHRFKILKACDKFEGLKYRLISINMLATSPGLSKNVSGIQMLTRADSVLIPLILRFYDFENIQQIATGRTCEVYKAEYKRKAEVSLKVLSNPSYLDQYKREVGFMKYINFLMQ